MKWKYETRLSITDKIEVVHKGQYRFVSSIKKKNNMVYEKISQKRII